MPDDLKFPFEYDSSGDAATASGEDFYYQHAQQLALLATEDVGGIELTETRSVYVRDTISETLLASPHIEPPIGVDNIEMSGDTLTADVTIGNIGDVIEI